MAVTIGSLIIRLAVEHGLLTQGLSASEKEVAKTTKAIQRKGREIADFGKNLSVAVSLPILALGASSIKAAKESADALGQVEASLASMGDASGRTSEQLQNLAKSQMRKSLIDDDEILRKVTANLLTFGNVSGEQFDRAQQAVIDMSTKTKKDLLPVTIAIGKALNDPVKGAVALKKAGVDLTDSQKALVASMVEVGNYAGAQNIILGELEKEYAGSAKAARDADPGAAATQAFAQFQEDIGAKLLPLLPVFTEAIVGVLDAFSALPDGVQTTIIVVAGLAAALGPVLIGLGALVSTGAGTIAMLTSLKLAFDIGGLIRNLIPMIGALGRAMLLLLANPILLAAAVVIGGIFLAWQNWDKIKPIIDRVVAAVVGFWNDNVRPVLTELGGMLIKAVSWWVGLQIGAIKAIAALVTGVKDWIVGRLGAVWDAAAQRIERVKGFFFDLYDAVVGNSYIPDMVEGIRGEMGKLQAFMVDPAQKATQSVDAAMRGLAERVRGHLAELYPEIVAAEAKAARIADLFAGERAGLITPEARRDAVRRAQGFDDGPLVEADKIKGAVDEINGAVETLAQRNEVQTVRVAKSFQDMVNDILGSVRGLVDGIRSGDFLSILEGVTGLFSQLGGAGVFGGGVQNFLQRTPGFANGTAFAPGGLAMVGERGPEVINLPRGGRVIPNHELRSAGAQSIRIILDERTDLIEARIDGRIFNAAPQIVGAGADMAMGRIRQAQARALA